MHFAPQQYRTQLQIYSLQRKFLHFLCSRRVCVAIIQPLYYITVCTKAFCRLYKPHISTNVSTLTTNCIFCLSQQYIVLVINQTTDGDTYRALEKYRLLPLSLNMKSIYVRKEMVFKEFLFMKTNIGRHVTLQFQKQSNVSLHTLNKWKKSLFLR